MKKYLGVLVVAVFALALTGCGKGNTLTCTKGDEKITLTFSGDKVTKAVYSMTLETEEEAQMYEAFGSLVEGVKIKRSGKKIDMTYSGDALKEMEFEGTKEDVKKDAEADGYKCK